MNAFQISITYTYLGLFTQTLRRISTEVGPEEPMRIMQISKGVNLTSLSVHLISHQIQL